MRDVIKDHVYDAGLEYASTIDDVANSIILGLTQIKCTITTGSLGTFASTPIIYVSTVGVGTDSATVDSVQYDTGVMCINASVSAGTATAYYSSVLNGTTMWVGSTTAGSLIPKDIQRVKGKMAGQYRHPNVLIISPKDYASLLFDAQAKFVDASVYGNNEPLLNGEVGKLLGMKVIPSDRMKSGNALLIDTERLGYDVRKRELEGVRQEKPEYDSVYYHFWGERNFGLADSFAVGAVVNAQSSDESFPAG